MTTLGNNIKAARLNAGFSRSKDFALAVQAPAPRVSDWERGRYSMLKIETLLRIAKAAQCSIDDLLAGVDADYDAVIAARDPIGHGTATHSASRRRRRMSQQIRLVFSNSNALKRATARRSTPLKASLPRSSPSCLQKLAELHRRRPDLAGSVERIIDRLLLEEP